MNFETRIALGLLLILVILSLQSCSQIPVLESIEQQSQQEAIIEDKKLDSNIPNFQGIANALGCVFAPNSCGSSK